MKNILPIIFVGYCICLYFSNAGAEIFTTILGLWGLTLFAKDLVQKKSTLYPKNLAWAFVILFIVAVISYFINPPLAGFKDSIFKFRWILLISFIGYLLKSDPKKYLDLFCKVSLVSLPILAFICFYQYTFGKDPFRENVKYIVGSNFHNRAVGMAGALTTSYLIGLVFVFFVSALIANKNRTKKDWITTGIVAISGLIIIFATLSRGPLLMAILTFLTGLFIVKNKEAIWSFFALIVCSALAIFLIPTLHTRFSTLLDFSSPAIAERLKIWRVHMDLFLGHPLLGVGFGNSQYYLKEGFESHGWFDILVYTSAGSHYTEFLSGLGILGFIAFYFVCFLFLKFAYDCYSGYSDLRLKILSYGLMSAQIFFHFGGLIEGIFFSTQPRHMMILIWALVLALKINLIKIRQEQMVR